MAKTVPPRPPKTLDQIAVFDALSYPKKPTFHKVVDGALFFARIALGREYLLEHKGGVTTLSEQKSAHVALRILAGIVATALLPITFVALLIKACLMSSQKEQAQKVEGVAKRGNSPGAAVIELGTGADRRTPPPSGFSGQPSRVSEEEMIARIIVGNKIPIRKSQGGYVQHVRDFDRGFLQGLVPLYRKQGEAGIIHALKGPVASATVAPPAATVSFETSSPVPTATATVATSVVRGGATATVTTAAAASAAAPPPAPVKLKYEVQSFEGSSVAFDFMLKTNSYFLPYTQEPLPEDGNVFWLRNAIAKAVFDEAEAFSLLELAFHKKRGDRLMDIPAFKEAAKRMEALLPVLDYVDLNKYVLNPPTDRPYYSKDEYQRRRDEAFKAIDIVFLAPHLYKVAFPGATNDEDVMSRFRDNLKEEDYALSIYKIVHANYAKFIESCKFDVFGEDRSSRSGRLEHVLSVGKPSK